MSYYAGCVNNAVISGNNYHFQCGNYHLKSKIWIQGQAITSVTESALVKIQAIEDSEELLFFASWNFPITHFSIKFNLTFSSSGDHIWKGYTDYNLYVIVRLLPKIFLMSIWSLPVHFWSNVGPVDNLKHFALTMHASIPWADVWKIKLTKFKYFLTKG